MAWPFKVTLTKHHNIFVLSKVKACMNIFADEQEEETVRLKVQLHNYYTRQEEMIS